MNIIFLFLISNTIINYILQWTSKILISIIIIIFQNINFTNYRIAILLRKHSDMSSNDISIMKYQKSNISIKEKYFIFKYIFIKGYIVEHVRIDYETNSLE